VRSRLPVGIAPNNLSFHLDRLRHAGLITVVRKGRWKIYSARGEIMKNLLNYLTDDCSPRKRVLGEINNVEMWASIDGHSGRWSGREIRLPVS